MPGLQAAGHGLDHKAAPAARGRAGQRLCANVFGHYYLTAELMPLLGRGRRIIWTSSLEAYPWTFSTADIQALKATHSYGSTRRLTDVLALTAGLPATAPYADKFFGAGRGEKGGG